MAQRPLLRIDTELKPPYSPYIKDYINSPNAITVQIKCDNSTMFPVQISLCMMMENTTGLRLKTKTPNNLPKWMVTPDKPLVLCGGDLKGFFETENLSFTGITAAHYHSQGLLPGGFYKLTFAAYDTNGKLISIEEQPAHAWFILNKVPLITSPKNFDDIYLGENKRFYFEWAPRHDRVSGLSRIEYHFQMVEIPRNYTGAVEPIFHTLPVIFEKVTTNTSLLIDFLQIPLTYEHRYAYRVQAKAFFGEYESKIFEGQGYSPVRIFNYKGNCTSPDVVRIEIVAEYAAELSWEKQPEANRYTVLFRNMNTRKWERKDVPVPYLYLDNLEADTVYEYKIRSYCKNYPSPYSNTYTFSSAYFNKTNCSK
ncbi:MAG: hypothetical protein LBT61_01435 [Prevotellaceae bacterium]|nr:hypothetical protein [Prevotellaceae bacterium]